MGEKPVFRIGFLKRTGDFPTDFPGPEGKRDPFFLEPVPMGSWNQVLGGLVDRMIDGAFVPVPAAIDLVMSGIDIRLLFKGPKPGAAFIKNCRANIKSLADFRGKTILVPHGLSIYTLLVHRFMAAIGLRLGQGGSSEVFFEPMAAHLMVEALSYDHDARIGGFIAPEPFGTMAVQAGVGKMVCRAEKLWPGYPPDVFVLATDLVGSFPDAVYALVERLVKAFFPPSRPGQVPAGKGNADFLIDIKTIKQIERYMGGVFGADAGGMDITRAVQMDFALKAGATI